MKQSVLFTKTRREAPKDEVSKNAQLLIRGGFVHKEIAGVYSYLPLGLRVFKKIEQVIREEMNAIGGQEIFMTTLQDPEIWKKTDRWENTIDNWFKTELQNGSELGIALTHEEPLARIMSEHVASYRDLPRYVYQFQNKFRNELRAKSGIMRGREFMMKDLYSFSHNEEEFKKFYEECSDAYMRIFDRVGLGNITYRTFASGAPFSEFSDEFQTLSEAGEDTIYLHESKKIAVNKEVYKDEVLSELGLDKKDLVEKKSIEVGNIFPLGTKYSEALGLKFRDDKGDEHPVVMGSYGIGLGRLMGTIVEVHSDERGMVWPESVAPFDVHVVAIAGEERKGVRTFAEQLVMLLEKDGVEVLYDDRDESPGAKLADADLIGIPTRVVVSEKTLEKNKVEVKNRRGDEISLISKEELIKTLTK